MNEKEDNKAKDQSQRNQLLAFLVGGFLLGFVVALYLGAFSGNQYEKLSNWVSVLIAAVAVVLVAQTLKATRDTLTATQQMAKDQSRIGNAQIRPWLVVDNADIRGPRHECEPYITLKNYGYEPAVRIRVNCVWMGVFDVRIEDTMQQIVHYDSFVGMHDIRAIVSGKPHTIYHNDFDSPAKREDEVSREWYLIVGITYHGPDTGAQLPQKLAFRLTEDAYVNYGLEPHDDDMLLLREDLPF